jgi:predicted Zn-dependent protease
MNRGTTRKLLCLPLFACVALVMSGCATMDFVTGKQVNNLYELSDDVRMGSDMYREILGEARKNNTRVDNDPARTKKIRNMVNKIAFVSHLPSLPYEVAYLQTNIVNAFALPGGKVIICEGLLDPKDGLVKDDDELAAVIAHEIAHVTCRHSTEELTRQLPMNLLLLGGAIYAEAKGKEDLTLALGGVFLLYQGFILTKYSRDDEREADLVGLEYMARAGYDPRAAVRLWNRAALASEGENKLLSLMSTHPRSAERANLLESHLAQVEPIYERTKKGRPEPAPQHTGEGGSDGSSGAAARSGGEFYTPRSAR